MVSLTFMMFQSEPDAAGVSYNLMGADPEAPGLARWQHQSPIAISFWSAEVF